MTFLLICSVWPLERVIMSGTSIIAKNSVSLRHTPADTWCRNNVVLTSTRRYFIIVCLLGLWYVHTAMIQIRLRNTESDKSLIFLPAEETLVPWLLIERPLETLIKLHGCAGWSESSLDAHANFNLLLDIGSYFFSGSTRVTLFLSQIITTPLQCKV